MNVQEPDEAHLNAVIELLEITLSITDVQDVAEQIQLQLELLYINKEIICKSTKKQLNG